MFKDSTELLDFTYQEFEGALFYGDSTVKIFLEPCFSGNTEKIKEFCDKFEIETITEILREEFSDRVEIKSVVGKGHLNGVLKYSEGPCDLSYPLVWELTLIEK